MVHFQEAILVADFRSINESCKIYGYSMIESSQNTFPQTQEKYTASRLGLHRSLHMMRFMAAMWFGS